MLDVRLARARANEDSDVADALDRAIENLASGLEELRELARGIHPAILTDKGLEPALGALAEPRARRRRPDVRLRAAGPGRRVAAVGGTLQVTSPPGAGTRVRATIPVA